MSSPRNLHQLLLVRQLYEDAHLHTEREDTFSHTKAVILLDLSVEMMLNNVVLNLDPDLTVNASKGSQDTDRKTLWGNAATALNKAKGKRLSEFREMASLHALRNLVQHNGTEPTRTEVRRHLSAAERMLSAVFRDVYDLDFANFRIWSLIPHEDLRQLLTDCEQALERGHPDICIVGCSHAHAVIVETVRNYTKLRRARLSTSLFRSPIRHTAIPSNLPLEVQSQIRRAAKQVDSAIREGVGKFGRAVMRQIEFLEDEVVTIGVGMPLMDTRRFLKIADEIFLVASGEVATSRPSQDEAARKEAIGEARFMLNYLSRLVRLIEEAYPGLLGEVIVRMPLREQEFWKRVDGEKEA